MSGGKTPGDPLLSQGPLSPGSARTTGQELDNTHIPTSLNISSEEQKAERARLSRNRYTAKKKAQREQIESQLEEAQKEMQKLKLEQESLQFYNQSLNSIGSYTACMIQALTEARNTASQALHAGMQGLGQVQDWTRHQYILLPTAVELMTTTLWTPTESQMRWALQYTSTNEFENGHRNFFNRITELLRERQRNPSSQERIEKRVETLMALWVKFSLILIEERKDHMERRLCAEQVREFKQQQRAAAASGGGGGGGGGGGSGDVPQASPAVSAAAAAAAAAAYEDDDDEVVDAEASGGNHASHARQQLAIFSSQPLLDLGFNFPPVSSQQKQALDALWKKFKQSVREARRDLSRAVGAATAAFIANTDFIDGSFAPDSSAAMAESYLTTIEAATAADAFVKRESRAYMELFTSIIQLLSPLQLAHLKVAPNLQPLVPHLPLVCHLLLQEANVMDSSDGNTTRNNTSSHGSDDKSAIAVVEVPRVQMIDE